MGMEAVEIPLVLTDAECVHCKGGRALQDREAWPSGCIVLMCGTGRHVAVAADWG